MQKKIIAGILFIVIAGAIGLAVVSTVLSDRPRPGRGSELVDKTDHPVNETSVYLYFAERNRPYLKTEQRILSSPDNPVSLGRMILEALIKGPRRGMRRTLPADTELRALYVTKDRVAYADFTQEISEHHPGGSQSEFLTIYSIVNSLILNIPEIEKVKILIEGQESLTLAGHIDLTLPFKANMTLVR